MSLAVHRNYFIQPVIYLDRLPRSPATEGTQCILVRYSSSHTRILPKLRSVYIRSFQENTKKEIRFL